MPDRVHGKAFPDELELLRNLVERMPVGVYCIQNHRFAFVNATFAQALGYSKKEILDFDSVTEVMPLDQRGTIEEMLRRRDARDTADVRYFTIVRHADGRLLDVEVHGTVVNLSGDVTLIGAAVDVTAHLASSRRIKEREEYFRTLTENVSDIIAIVDADAVIGYVSPSVERWLGYPAAEVIGTVAFSCVHPDDLPRLSDALEKLVRGGSFGPAEFRARHRDGSWRLLEVVGTNLLQHSHIHGVVANLRDITDRRRMEQEVAQLHRLTSLGRLSSQVAHEFNNVLMGIQPMLDVMRRGAAGNAQSIRQIDFIGASVSRGKRITTDILRYGRPAQVTTSALDAGAVLQRVVDEIRPMLRSDVKLELVVSETPLALADPSQLSQVFMNLALNARDAMPAGGTLTFEVKLADGDETGSPKPLIHFRVSDTGTGITAEHLPYIFEPLFTTKKTGSGLGLSVVYQIVTLHGGRISVESEPGKGTTFDVFIPAITEAQHEEEAADEHPNPGCQRILIIEDEEMIAIGMRMSLEVEGLQVEVVGCGADVVPAIERFQPDLLVIDLLLPDADGRDVYAEVSKRFALPAVFSSGHIADWEIEELVAPGMTAFLMKPYSTRELLSTIGTLMSSHRSEIAQTDAAAMPPARRSFHLQ
jgi:PAS domain S-box-containing protein